MSDECRREEEGREGGREGGGEGGREGGGKREREGGRRGRLRVQTQKSTDIT